jgi:hypothetical protein
MKPPPTIHTCFSLYLRGALFLATLCAGLVLSVSPGDAREGTYRELTFETANFPAILLKDKNRGIEKYKFLGSWRIPGKIDREDAIRLSSGRNGALIRIAAGESRLEGASAKIITQTDKNKPYGDVTWGDRQISVIAFRAISENPRPAILKIEADGEVLVCNNGKSAKMIPGAKPHDYDSLHYAPLTLEKGVNIVCMKITSRNGPPRLRLAALVERAMDFQTAWESRGSLLAEKINYAGVQGNAPALKWNPLLDKLRVSVKVFDVLKNEIVLKKDNVTNGAILRDGPRKLPEGLYKATYQAKQESTSEYFVVGPPKTAFESLKQELEKLTDLTGEARLNIEAQIRRGEILVSRTNYDVTNKVWQEKIMYTLESLASMLNMIRDGRQNISKDIPGLHIRGFRSKIDNSRQYYRLFVPSGYEPARGLPLLLLMPTPVSDEKKSFIESPTMASHRNAVKIGKFAEKYGFAVVWPGYRNAPGGWTCEATHVDEVIGEIEKDYNIDKSRISVYGSCGGGYFAGRLPSVYQRRFAAIIYDKAIFDKKPETLRKLPEHLASWYEALSPVARIINNNQIKILVFNDGTAQPGHGDMEWSEMFVKNALEKRNDLKVHLGSRPLEIPFWDMAFEWLAPIRNEAHDPESSGFLKEAGYEGPVSEVFSEPFMIVRGTTTNSPNIHIDSAIELIKISYRQQFHGAEPIVRNDREITEQEIKDYSLILVGNPESNAIWKKMEARLPVKATPAALSIKGRQFSANSAFLAIFEHPMNAKRHVLTIGSYDLKHLGSIQRADPCKAWYDCRVFEPFGASYQTHIISKLNPITN